MTTFEKEIGIIEGTLDLEMARIDRDYKYGLGMAVATDTVLEYCMTESGDDQPGFFNRMIDAIASFIRGINEAVSNMSKKDDDRVNLDSFLQSQTGQVQLSYDMEKIDKDVNKKILEGRKMIQAISSATGISDEKVAAFADSCGNFADKYGGWVCKVAAIGAVRSFVAHKSLNNVDKAVSKLRGTDDYMSTVGKTRNEIAQGQKARKQAKAAHRQQQIKTVTGGLHKVVTFAGNAKTKVAGEINKVYADARKKSGGKAGGK